MIIADYGCYIRLCTWNGGNIGCTGLVSDKTYSWCSLIMCVHFDSSDFWLHLSGSHLCCGTTRQYPTGSFGTDVQRANCTAPPRTLSLSVSVCMSVSVSVSLSLRLCLSVTVLCLCLSVCHCFCFCLSLFVSVFLCLPACLVYSLTKEQTLRQGSGGRGGGVNTECKVHEYHDL